ncbi:6-phosphofructokinase [Aliifodinibius sp. S!AR15-10]|uniref:6-phosphofructokinase n=1 Tax=Aliifodinibius sp. S!AR15-10 TaxID=2950437 RepID=UPI002863F68D|nr:6-phosphofructokinase [Aliifodinibius sp. S!AR15-10]MDR8390324.1 6-phosphofructokinase [Aliifodinibius sp. S!AR15-10]
MSDQKLQKIGVLTSGGDAPGMNAAIRAVVRACIYYDITPYGIREGYEGLIQNDMYRMEAGSVKHIIHQGGTILKSTRCDGFRTKEGRQKAYDNLQKRGIEALVVIGGDGTFQGANIFGKEFDFPVLGIPGTIDNDISGTDFTIGFDTATNTVIEAVDQIRDTATSHNRLFFIEVMGRDSGYIAISSGIAAGAEEILIPEKDRGMDKLIQSLEQSSRRNKTSRLVIVAEGEKSGSIYELADNVKQKFGERYEIKVTVLGHIQRGGRPSCADRVLASRLGVAAVEALKGGKKRIMVGVQNHKVVHTNLEKATKQRNTIDEDLLKIADIVSI